MYASYVIEFHFLWFVVVQLIPVTEGSAASMWEQTMWCNVTMLTQKKKKMTILASICQCGFRKACDERSWKSFTPKPYTMARVKAGWIGKLLGSSFGLPYSKGFENPLVRSYRVSRHTRPWGVHLYARRWWSIPWKLIKQCWAILPWNSHPRNIAYDFFIILQ